MKIKKIIERANNVLDTDNNRIIVSEFLEKYIKCEIICNFAVDFNFILLWRMLLAERIKWLNCCIVSIAARLSLWCSTGGGAWARLIW